MQSTWHSKMTAPHAHGRHRLVVTTSPHPADSGCSLPSRLASDGWWLCSDEPPPEKHQHVMTARQSTGRAT